MITTLCATTRPSVPLSASSSRADCAPLASKSTLNRFELAAAGRSESINRKVVADFKAMAELMVEFFIEITKVPPKEIVLDLDANDVPLYGDQEEKFFHGYYKEYCTMPLLVFCKRMRVMALLRSAARDVAAGIVPELDLLIQRIRAHWPDVRIILRTDSGFCRYAPEVETYKALDEGIAKFYHLNHAWAA